MRVVEQLRVGNRHARVAMRRDLDEPGALEPLEGFADGRARDAEPPRELLVAQVLTGFEASLEDRLADRRVHLVAEDIPDRVDGNERQSCGHQCSQVYVERKFSAETPIYR